MVCVSMWSRTLQMITTGWALADKCSASREPSRINRSAVSPSFAPPRRGLPAEDSFSLSLSEFSLSFSKTDFHYGITLYSRRTVCCNTARFLTPLPYPKRQLFTRARAGNNIYPNGILIRIKKSSRERQTAQGRKRN